MTIKDVATMTRLSEQLIRCWINRGNCPFGSVINEGRKGRKTYLINEERFKAWQRGEL